jgi:hypothetical protein
MAMRRGMGFSCGGLTGANDTHWWAAPWNWSSFGRVDHRVSSTKGKSNSDLLPNLQIQNVTNSIYIVSIQSIVNANTSKPVNLSASYQTFFLALIANQQIS